MGKGAPSLYQTMLGEGRPSAPQFKVTGSFRGTVQFVGCSVMRGARGSPEGDRT